MSAVGRLLIRIGSDTGGLRRGGKQAEGVITKLGGAAGKVTRRMAQLGTAATAAGAAIAAGLTKRGLDAVAAQDRLARTLSTTNRQVAGLTTAFAAYGLQTDDVSDAINTLSDRAQDAASGMQSMADDFELVGMNIDDLRGKRPVELFRSFASSISDVEDPQKRVAAAVRIFGDDIGRKLLPMLMQGEGALDRFTERADRMGLVLSNIESSQVEQAQIAMRQMGNIVDAVSTRLAVELSPIIQGVARLLGDAAEETGGFENIIANLVDNGINGLGMMMDFVHRLKVAFVVVRESVANLDAGIQIMALKAFNSIMTGPVNGINKLIEAANNIPGIEFDTLEMPSIVGQAEQQIAGLRNSIRDNQDQIRAALREPLPSEGLDEWVRITREQSRAAAESMAADREAEREAVLANQRALAAQSGELSEQEREREAERRQDNLARLRDYLASEKEAEVMAHQRRMEWLTEARNSELVTEQEYRKLKEEAERQHQAELTKIANDGLSDREKFNRKSMDAQVGQVANSLQNMTASVARENKAMFAINKAAGIANAVVNTYQGVTKSLSAYPMPLAGAMAAAHLAAGMAQVSQIKSQSFSSGGSAGGGSVGTSAATSAAQNAPAPPTQQGSDQTFTVRGLQSGDLFTGETMRELLENIEEASEDGRTRIRVV